MATLGAGCAALPAPPVVAPHEGQPSPRPGLQQDRPAPGVLRPGDGLRLEVLSVDERSYPQLLVSATGQLHVPGLGDIEVAGLTLSQAEALIVERQRRVDAQARAVLYQVSQAGARVTVLGAVTRQGGYPLTPGMRMADAIGAAGGPLLAPPNSPSQAALPLADLSRAVVSRGGKALPIDLERALRGEAGHNVFAHPGDHIFVPPRREHVVSVLGQVGRPSVLVHHEGMRLTEALALAGGVTRDGDGADIRLLRGPPEAPQVFSASLAAIKAGKGRDATLAPGDVLFVTDQWLEDLREVMGVLMPLTSLASAALLIAIVSQ